MDQKRFSALLERYLREDLSREEAAQLLDSLQDDDMRRQWETTITGLLENKEVQGLSDRPRMEAIRRSIMAGKTQPKPLFKRLLPYAAAAAVILLIATLYIFQPFTETTAPLAVNTKMLPLAPGGDRAMLTLADGSQIPLDSAGNGAIAAQGNVQVVKLNSGQLAYNSTQAGKESQVSYNTLS